MKILALESSAKAASCAVLADGIPLATAWQATGLTHSRTLLPMVQDMLRSSELELSDMDAIAIAAGPGSFTGLRIGIASVKGLSWAADKPCIGPFFRFCLDKGQRGGEKLRAKAGRGGLFLALMLFVGIPLPGTGAWTGTLAASFLNMGIKSTVAAVTLGVVLAAIIMVLGSHTVASVIA